MILEFLSKWSEKLIRIFSWFLYVLVPLAVMKIMKEMMNNASEPAKKLLTNLIHIETGSMLLVATLAYSMMTMIVMGVIVALSFRLVGYLIKIDRVKGKCASVSVRP